MKFSVITVCLNNVDTIERTIQSILEQDYDDIEYIIIDGGSIDGTVDIIKKYEDKIAFWVSEPDNGIYDAMNKGISYATGDVISFLNSSDWYNPRVLHTVYESFCEDECDIISGKHAEIRDGAKVAIYPQEHIEKNIYIYMAYPHRAMFAKRELFNKYGCFDLKYKVAADYDWELRVWKKWGTDKGNK